VGRLEEQGAAVPSGGQRIQQRGQNGGHSNFQKPAVESKPVDTEIREAGARKPKAISTPPPPPRMWLVRTGVKRCIANVYTPGDSPVRYGIMVLGVKEYLFYVRPVHQVPSTELRKKFGGNMPHLHLSSALAFLMEAGKLRNKTRTTVLRESALGCERPISNQSNGRPSSLAKVDQ
jgi:hypothetical protein